MFQFRRFPAYAYFIQRTLTVSSTAGLPHSDIHGSLRMCRSPWLFAACHVLLRLLMPRHPPCALLRLTFVVAKSALLRFRRKPSASVENFARFLAPPLQIAPASLGCNLIFGTHCDVWSAIKNSCSRIMQAPLTEVFI